MSSTAPPTPLPSGDELRAALDKDGFVRIRNAFSQEDLARFKMAASHAAQLGREGKWQYVRTVPKHFPPWPVGDAVKDGIWGVQHLLHPSWPAEDRRIFAESYFGETMVTAVTRLLDCEKGELVMELYNMLVRPPKDFALRWHRDDIPPDVSAEEEMQRLGEPMVHAQWNLALYPDRSLVVVPGSHRRPRTEMERNADPFEDEMPGQMVVEMEAGDVVFYNNNILHRGVYDSKGGERMTLHGTMGLKGRDGARARNILQHGIGGWAGECDFGELGEGEMGQLARAMQRRLMEMGTGEGVGFSQRDQ